MRLVNSSSGTRSKADSDLAIPPSTAATNPHLGFLPCSWPDPAPSLLLSQVIILKYRLHLPKSAPQSSAAPYCLLCTGQTRPSEVRGHRCSGPPLPRLVYRTSPLLSNLCSPHLQGLPHSAPPSHLPFRPGPGTTFYKKPPDFSALGGGWHLRPTVLLLEPPPPTCTNHENRWERLPILSPPQGDLPFL